MRFGPALLMLAFAAVTLAAPAEESQDRPDWQHKLHAWFCNHRPAPAEPLPAAGATRTTRRRPRRRPNSSAIFSSDIYLLGNLLQSRILRYGTPRILIAILWMS